MKTLNRRNRAFRNLITWDSDREELEQRLVPATITVTNLNDSGSGSLRNSITAAGLLSGDDTIVFDSSLSNGVLILSSQLLVNDTTGNLTVAGLGNGPITITSLNASRIIEVDTPITLSNLILSNGKADNLNGGAIYARANTVLNNITIKNSQAGYGGAIATDANVRLTISNSTLILNSAKTGGALYIGQNSSLTIANSVLSNNTATLDFGGAIKAQAGIIAINDSVLQYNSAPNKGGVIYYDSTNSTGQMTINRSTVRNNNGVFYQHAISGCTTTVISNSTISQNSGDGFFNDGSEGNSILTINSSVFSNNTGSAIRNDGGLTGNAKLTVNTSTFAFNQAASGAIFNNLAVATINDSTIAYNNIGISSGDGITAQSIGSVKVYNSIIANNFGAVDIAGDVLLDHSLYGTILGNLENGTSNNIQSNTPGLGSLGSYGGLTNTVPLLNNSPAIGAGVLIGRSVFDQRGAAYLTSDIGSFAMQNSTLSISFGDDVNIDQNLYTVAGAYQINVGTLFQIDSSGKSTIISNINSTNMNDDYENAGLIFDNKGNLMVVDKHGGKVLKFSYGSNVPTDWVSGLILPDGLAYDKSGNLYISCFGLVSEGWTAVGYVEKVTPSGVRSIIANNLVRPTGIVIDTNGYLYVCQSLGTRNILKISPDGKSSVVIWTDPYTENSLLGQLAFDSNGNLLCAVEANRVVVIDLSSGNASDLSILPSSFRSRGGIAYDNKGDLYLITEATTIAKLSGQNYTQFYSAFGFSGHYLAFSPYSQITTYGQTFTLKSQLRPSFGSASGFVRFYSDGNLIGTAPVINNTAVLTVSNLSSGQHLFTSDFDGNAGLLGSTSDSIGGIIKKANLTINPNVVNKVYGSNVPNLTYTSLGLVNGDQPSIIIGSLSTNALANSSVGQYVITQGNISAGSNYNIIFNNGVLNVTKATVNVIANSSLRTYGSNNPVFPYTFNGLVNNDTVSIFTGSLASNPTSNTPVGNYPISIGSLSAGNNYSINFTPGTLSVTPATLTVNGSSITNQYGNNLPLLTYKYSGLVNGDGISVFSGSLATTANSASSVGSYPITVGNFSAGSNYKINFTNGTLNITKADTYLTLSATSNLVYGSKGLIIARVASLSNESGTPTGNVSFYDGSTLLGNSTLDLSGNASYPIESLTSGSHVISAKYLGDLSRSKSSTLTNSTTLTNLDVYGNFTNTRAMGVSDDGNVVIGNANGFYSGFRWTATSGFTNLGFRVYNDTSFDGNSIAGKGPNGTILWTPNGTKNLGITTSGRPGGLSRDGSSVMGYVSINSKATGYYWSDLLGIQYLGTLGGNDSYAWGSNYDGSIIVGESTISNGDTRAFIYSSSTGMTDLGMVSNAKNIYAYSASNNGQVIVGEIDYSNGLSRSMRWTPQTGVLDLGSLLSTDNAYSYAVSSDGNQIVGVSTSGAFIWDPINRMRSISDVVSTQGIDISNWIFTEALSISGNSTSGYNIVGSGTYQGQTRAFLIKGLQPLAPQPLTITINKASSASVITSSTASSIYGASVTYYTTVTPVAPGIGLPSGNVDFYDGAIKIGSASLDTSGVASLEYSNSVVGTHAISARYQGDSNFTNSNSTTDIGVTISKASLNVTGINSSKLYGANNPTFTYSYSGLVAGDTSSVFSGSLSTTATTTSPVGVYPINQGSLTAGTNYDINYTNGNLTVTPAALSVTISSTSKLYGAGLPNFSFNYSGFLNGDTPSLFSGSLTTTATANSSVGTYPISVGTLSAGPNYAIVPTNGTLIINPASLAVTGSNQSKSYGANVPDLKYSYSGLVNGDTESVFSGSLTTTATANSPVGSYPITVGSLAAGSNYNIAFTNGTLSVTSSSLLVVTATNKTKVYGDILPTLSYTYSGLVNGDTSAVFTGNLMTTATSESAVGIYGITQGNLSAGSNYAITFNNGTLTVTPATITVTASNSTKSYGGAIPALNYSYSGLVNGDTSSIFTGGLSTSASTSSVVGNYNITQGSLSAGNNYSIIYTNGTLSVTPANLSVSANNLTKTFGAAIPPLTYVYTGLVNNDSSSVFSGNLVTSATSSSVVANYPITRGNLSAGNNYNISFVNGTLSVIKSGSSTSISAPSTAVAGTNVTISASVTATAPGAGIPTGSVQFYDATTLIGTVSVNSNAQASIVTGSLSLGNHILSAIYVGDSSFNTSTSGSANITIQAGALSIQSFSSDASAVTVKFNQAIATSSLQINDAYTGNTLTEVADLKVTDGNGQSVKGSMIVASDAKSVTFIKTGTAFANGTYTIRLRSGSNAFRNTSGEFLDGNNDGVAGGDYVTTFAVANSSRVLSIPDVVRGPGQAVRVNTTDLGVPVKVNDGTDIFAFEVSVNYDPALMSVTDVVVPSNLSSFLQISFNSSVAGRIDVVGIAVNGLPGGSQNLFYVNGTVPNGVLYRSKAELSLSDVNLYKLDNSTISTTLDQGVQLVSYIGDVTGDGRYNALDPLRIQRYLVNLDRWFAQFPLVDPLLVADVTGDGKVNALDALYMQRYLVNLPVPYLSAPPVTSVTQSGLDPIIRLPKNLSAMRGQVVQVPVELQNTDSKAINVNSFEVAVQIDPQAFRLMKIKSSDKIRTHYDDVRGILIIAGILPEVTLQPGESMIICSLQIKISAHTKATDYVLNLLEDVTIGRAHYATSVNGGTLKLVPAPTNESNDSVDGNIRILERPNRFVSGEAVRKYPVLKRSRFGFITR